MEDQPASTTRKEMTDSTTSNFNEKEMNDNTTSNLNKSSNASPDWIPQMGMEFDTMDDAFEFWLNYGGRMGFGVRILYSNKSKIDGHITSSRFVCSKEGTRREDKRDAQTKKPRAETRTNCLARLGVKFMRETGKVKVHDIVYEHNHSLHTPATSHMIPSQRKISDVQAIQIDLADASGLKPKASHQFFSQQVGGKENLGHTERDQKNYLRTKRQNDLAYGEAGSLLRYLFKQSCDNPSFQYDIQLDSEEQITNIFWADARMIDAYAHFGDVVTFDTTYSTNKEYRPFGVFAGFNHHRETVIFGAALLYDETAASFEWLFKTFQQIHKKPPKTIFTDQDPAMGKALAKVLPDTYHGLCSWHIMHNGIKHLGHLMKDGSFFLTEFSACMYKHEEEKGFQDAWEAMLEKYEVTGSGKTWLESIYKIKEKWAKCCMKSVFTAGMRSTQLSESLNSNLKAYLKSDMDIIRFCKQFERVSNEKNYKELVAEYNSRQKLPRMKIQKSPILQQAAKIYTPLIFEKYFQEEFDWFLAAVIKQRDESIEMHEYTIAIVDEKREHKEQKVRYQPSDQTVSCSCMKFQSWGILCCHALKVLDVWDIKKIPEKYILKRWTREARCGAVKSTNGTDMIEDTNLNVAERYRTLCPLLVTIASRASEDEKAFTLVYKAASELRKQVEDIFLNDTPQLSDKIQKSSQNNNESMEQENSPLKRLLQKVKGLKKKTGFKGRKRRLKSWVESMRKSNKKSTKKDESILQEPQEENVEPSKKRNITNKDKSIPQEPQVENVEPSKKRNRTNKDKSKPQEPQEENAQQSRKRGKVSSNKDQLDPQESHVLKGQESRPSRKQNTRSSNKKVQVIPQEHEDQEAQLNSKNSKDKLLSNRSLPKEYHDQEAQPPSNKRKKQLSSRLFGYET